MWGQDKRNEEWGEVNSLDFIAIQKLNKTQLLDELWNIRCLYLTPSKIEMAKKVFNSSTKNRDKCIEIIEKNMELLGRSPRLYLRSMYSAMNNLYATAKYKDEKTNIPLAKGMADLEVLLKVLVIDQYIKVRKKEDDLESVLGEDYQEISHFVGQIMHGKSNDNLSR